MHNMKALEGKLAEWLAQYLNSELIHEAMLEVPALAELDDELFWQIRDALVAQVAKGGIQVTVKLPSSKALAKQRRNAKVSL